MQPLRLLLLLGLSWQQAAQASTLIRRGRLEQISTDTSRLTTGGQRSSHTAGAGCSSNAFHDECATVPGTRVYLTDSTNGPVYIFNGNTVTLCSRWRRESNCQTCNSMGCTVTTPVDFGGSTITSQLDASVTTEIAALALSNGNLDSACSGVCTNPTDASNVVFPLKQSSECQVAHGWVAVNDDYDEACAVGGQECLQLQVSQGCDDTETGSVAGVYTPLQDTSGCSDDGYVDKTRTIYANNGHEKFLFYRDASNEWTFSSFCSSLGNSKGFFDAGDEPFLNTEAEVQCWDGGFGSSKTYDWTPLQLSCLQKANGGSGRTGGGLGGVGGLGGGGGGSTSSAPPQAWGPARAMVVLSLAIAVASLF